MVKVVSLLMAIVCMGASQPMTLDEKPSENVNLDAGIVTEVKPIKKPPYIDGGYDIYGETDGYVQPRFDEKSDGTIGEVGQKSDGTMGEVGQKDDGTIVGVGRKNESKVDVNALFENKKKQLDEKYSKLFYLLEREDQLSDELRKINEEYWKLKEMYDKEYKKLLCEWSKSYEIFSE